MKSKALRPALSGLFLALALLLPFITASDPKIGSMLLPMHLPILLCGFICGPIWGASVGLAAPLLRSILFSAPLLFPNAVTMSLELSTYGLVCGILLSRLPQRIGSLYIALIAAMISGRIVWGLASLLFYSLAGGTFGWQMFLSGAIITAAPGIILQLIFVPTIASGLKKYLKI